MSSPELAERTRSSGVPRLLYGWGRTASSSAPAPLSSTPQEVARAVTSGLDHDAHTVWAPATLRWLMLAVRLLPRPLFRRMRQ
jgi:hypothetical protein